MAEHDVTGRFVCANSACRVAETGRCVEGFELKACPHFGREPQGNTAESAAEERAGRDSRPGIALRAADTLTSTAAEDVLRAGDTRVVPVIGPSDSGKTSLIASVYELFQEGSVEGVEFSRSHTLHAFEQACHDARAASRRSVPHMNRTPRGEVRFYHLELSGAVAGDRRSLTLGDRAGEEYREASDDVAIAAGFPEIARADSLTVLVDGERLIDTGARHNLKSEIILTLQALLDGDVLPPQVGLAVVLTKLDAVRVSPDAGRAERDFLGLIDDIRRVFGNVLTEVEQFRVAASPKTEALKRGTGVPSLLSFWLGAMPRPSHAGGLLPIPARAFGRLMAVDETAE
jgi:hypothetical protein